MEKDPAVLFYTADFLASTTLWNNEEIGMYIKLLCLQHLQDGLSRDDIDTVCGDCSKVRDKFKFCDDGLYRNQRMAKEKEKRAKFSESRRANALKRFSTANVEHMQSTCKAYAEHMGNENINENKNKSINENINNDQQEKEEPEEPKEKKLSAIEKRFNIFWEAYPKKASKIYAFKCFEKLKVSDELLDRMIKAISEQKRSVEWTKDGGQYIPNPSTWLNQGKWMDEVVSVQPAPASAPAPIPKQQDDDFVGKYNSSSADAMLEAALRRSYGG